MPMFDIAYAIHGIGSSIPLKGIALYVHQ